MVSGALENNTTIQAFDEEVVVLAGDLDVNWIAPGGGSGALLAGSTVQSHILHFDANNKGATTSDSATFTFSHQILGVIWNKNRLASTDGFLGLGSVAYAGTANARGLDGFEFNNLTIVGNTFSTEGFRTSGKGIDQVRVLTAVPLPATVWLFGSAVMGLISLRRRNI